MHTVDSDHCLTWRRELDKSQKTRTCIHCDKTGRVEEFASPSVCGARDAKRCAEWKERWKETTREIICRVCEKKAIQQMSRGHAFASCHKKKCRRAYKKDSSGAKVRSKISRKKCRARNRNYVDALKAKTSYSDCGRSFLQKGWTLTTFLEPSNGSTSPLGFTWAGVRCAQREDHQVRKHLCYVP